MYILLAQIASMNVFCIMWQLEGIISCERLSLILCKAVGTGEEGVIGDASTPLSL